MEASDELRCQKTVWCQCVLFSVGTQGGKGVLMRLGLHCTATQLVWCEPALSFWSVGGCWRGGRSATGRGVC